MAAAPESRKSAVSGSTFDRKTDISASESLKQTEVATRLVISDRQVRNLTNSGVITRNENGTYPWPAVHEEYLKYKMEERERRYSPTDPASMDLEEQQTRLTAARAELAELDLAVRRGELLHIRDMILRVREPLGQIDGALRNMPSRHAAELAQLASVTIPVAMSYLNNIVERIRGDLRMVRNAADTDAA